MTGGTLSFGLTVGNPIGKDKKIPDTVGCRGKQCDGKRSLFRCNQFHFDREIIVDRFITDVLEE